MISVTVIRSVPGRPAAVPGALSVVTRPGEERHVYRQETDNPQVNGFATQPGRL
ncbi:hypothetical protein SAMN05216511_0618 [Streptomyces sp. KS_16]|nr:hypothetical protein BX261_6632 [Streptomyces sp. 2321.6]SDQ80859.1 hypothetical protein SAMN05216511_0618 [Streptomyces sp. KS_16]SEE01654.1 hypothetical protein SAMN05428940_6660 [Streptomyces sp. 2133.1]SNC73557.1 hypothetical protein SAMN06272741_6561 [Streptomyces sp. 2114.4]